MSRLDKSGEVPAVVQDAVLVKTSADNLLSGNAGSSSSAQGSSSDAASIDKQVVSGYDFNKGLDYDELFKSYMTTGFQATSLAKAIAEINRMLAWQQSEEDLKAEQEGSESDSDSPDQSAKEPARCTIFLGYTSNMASCGMREVIRFLVQHKLVDCIVTTAGGVEEDFIKCMAPTFTGDFGLKGDELRRQGINRIGNLLVPNDNYCLFEDWIMPILDKMLEEQKSEGTIWSPSKMIDRLGKEIDDETSIYYWAQKNNIPVFCPAITDGSLGDMIYFHSYKNPGLVVDIASDIRAINSKAVFAKKTGMVIIGGGVVKHHICNANLMRNGADFSVFINTAQEFDGSDAGARPDEAVSWGKIRMDAKPVKVYAEATIVFPLIVAQSFYKEYLRRKEEQESSRE